MIQELVISKRLASFFRKVLIRIASDTTQRNLHYSTDAGFETIAASLSGEIRSTNIDTMTLKLIL